MVSYHFSMGSNYLCFVRKIQPLFLLKVLSEKPGKLIETAFNLIFPAFFTIFTHLFYCFTFPTVTFRSVELTQQSFKEHLGRRDPVWDSIAGLSNHGLGFCKKSKKLALFCWFIVNWPRRERKNFRI
jgi:hypothetical protein